MSLNMNPQPSSDVSCSLFTSETVQVFSQLRCRVFLLQLGAHFLHFPGQRGKTRLQGQFFHFHITPFILQCKKKNTVQLLQHVISKHCRVARLCTDLQVSAFPRQGALQSQVEPAGGRVLSAAVHCVQAGVASLLHQGRKAGGADGLLKLLDELEEGPEGGGRRASAQPWRDARHRQRREEACQASHRWVFSTDCLMDQKLTSFHLEILTKS